MNTPSFLIGVWAQPIESFPKWKAEGVNLVIHPDTTANTNVAQRRKACADNQLFYMDTPSDVNDTMALIADPWCYGLMYPDEPSNQAPWFSSNPAAFKAFVDAYNAKWTPLLSPAKGKKPIWVNFAGGHVNAGRPWNMGGQVVPFADLADEVSQDSYAIATNVNGQWDLWNAGKDLPVGINPNAPVDPLAVGTTLSQYTLRCLKLYFPNKPVWSYVETCTFDSNPSARQITAADFKLETTSILKEGIKGLIYFTHNFKGPGWSPGGGPGQTDWDGRPADVAAACIELNKKLTSPPPPVDLTPRVSSLESRMDALEAKLAKVKVDL